MNVKIGKDGEINLEDLFSKKLVEKIQWYSIDKDIQSGNIKIMFYDRTGKVLKPKLKKV